MTDTTSRGRLILQVAAGCLENVGVCRGKNTEQGLIIISSADCAVAHFEYIA